MHDHKLTQFTYLPSSNRDSYIYQYVVAHRTQEDLEKFIYDHLLCELCKQDLVRQKESDDDWVPENIWQTACMAEYDYEDYLDTLTK